MTGWPKAGTKKLGQRSNHFMSRVDPREESPPGYGPSRVKRYGPRFFIGALRCCADGYGTCSYKK
jgi:hypothetical protein